MIITKAGVKFYIKLAVSLEEYNDEDIRMEKLEKPIKKTKEKPKSKIYKDDDLLTELLLSKSFISHFENKKKNISDSAEDIPKLREIGHSTPDQISL